MTGIAGLLAGSGQYLKWENPGTSYTGTITEVALRQARKYESTELDYWDDGTPKMQVVLTLATEYRDPGNEDDDGTRMLSINLWSGQKKALIAACKAAGVAEPEVGQTFRATHKEGIGNAKNPRVFEYVITPGPTGVAAALGDPAQVVEQPAAPAPAAANPAETAKQLLAAGGLSHAEIATATGLPEAVVAALANTL
jgi:hypothetical protein